MHYEILDDKRRALLPLLATFRERFYLAGGTALALQLGHRDSIDFDFFTQDSFDTAKLFAECETVFAGHTLQKIQEETSTLGILVDGVQISFLGYPYPLVRPLIRDEHLSLASLEDIACMKCSAITSRSTLKDYVDLHVLFQRMNLADVLSLLSQKLPLLDHNLVLKSLVYFDDIIQEPIRYTTNHAVSFQTIAEDVRALVHSHVNKSDTSKGA